MASLSAASSAASKTNVEAAAMAASASAASTAASVAPTASTVLPLTAVPLPRARDVPATFFSSVRSWWAAGEKEGQLSEERLLRKLPFFQSSSWPRTDQSSPVIGTSCRVELPNNPKHFINTFSIAPVNPSLATGKEAPPPAVVLHGYGAGLGFFFLNFPTLAIWAARTSSPVYALDWLGMGRSSRPPFKIHAKRTDIPGRVHEAESFFVDSLEAWREKTGLAKMQLVGHSLGAYLATCYALRYPERVSRLVLLSPAGVPHGPDSIAGPAREIADEQGDITHGQGHNVRQNVESASAANVDRMREEQKEEKRKETTTQKLFTYLWEEGWSPFQLVRTMTVFGPLFIGKYSSRRFSNLTEEEVRDVNDYILNITLAKGSGEYCISHILAPFAYARLPLVDRISALKIPVTFVYGEHDWMDPEGGAESVRKLREAGNSHAKMYIIKSAGHHVYLDNAQAVNDLLMKELSKA